MPLSLLNPRFLGSIVVSEVRWHKLPEALGALYEPPSKRHLGVPMPSTLKPVSLLERVSGVLLLTLTTPPRFYTRDNRIFLINNIKNDNYCIKSAFNVVDE